VKIAPLVSELRWLESRPLKKEKNKEKTSVKYIALPASLASGLNQKRGPDRENSRKYFLSSAKIVKIGPVEPEIALLKVKNEEINKS